eukprot:638578-Pyramimonas_sp.AAC.1
MTQDSPSWLKMAPKMLQEAQRPLQDGSRWPGSIPRRPRRSIYPSTMRVSSSLPRQLSWASFLDGLVGFELEKYPPPCLQDAMECHTKFQGIRRFPRIAGDSQGLGIPRDSPGFPKVG